MLLLTADVEKIAELASAADGLYGMTRSCYGSGWFSPSSSQNRNFAIVAKNLNGIELPTADGPYGMTRLCYRSGW